MNPAADLLAETARSAPRPRPTSTRWLYPAFSALLYVVMLLGFQQFYLHGRAYPGQPIAPPVRTVIIAHGLAMTGWMTLFLAQPLLIAAGNRRAHIALGTLGGFLATAIVALGLYVPIATTRAEPDIVLWGLNRRHFVAIPYFAVLMFGAFVAFGLRNRRRPEIHRPMMLLATLSIIAAAADRITGLPDLYAATMWGRIFGPFFTPLVIGALFLAVKSALTRSLDRWFAAGYAAQVAVCAFTMAIAPTAAWGRFVDFLVR